MGSSQRETPRPASGFGLPGSARRAGEHGGAVPPTASKPAQTRSHLALPRQAPPPEMPDMSQLPPEMLEGMARMQANSEFFLAHLLATTIEHIPDVAALQVATPRIVVGVGEASQGQMPHRAALALAERLAASPVSFPGDHQ